MPRLTPEPGAVARQRVEEEVAPSLNDLRAAVDALKRPPVARRVEAFEPAESSDASAADEATEREAQGHTHEQASPNNL